MNLRDPGIEPGSPALQADYLPTEPSGKPFSKLARLFGVSEVALVVKILPTNLGDIRDMDLIPWRRKWLPTLVFLPGESHGQRSLADYSP